MTLLKIASLSIALIAAPAFAQGRSNSHEVRWSQAGKVPIASYHPVKRTCVQQVAPIHLSGKTPFVTHSRNADCSTSVASNDKTNAEVRKD